MLNAFHKALFGLKEGLGHVSVSHQGKRLEVGHHLLGVDIGHGVNGVLVDPVLYQAEVSVEVF